MSAVAVAPVSAGVAEPLRALAPVPEKKPLQIRTDMQDDFAMATLSAVGEILTKAGKGLMFTARVIQQNLPAVPSFASSEAGTHPRTTEQTFEEKLHTAKDNYQIAMNARDSAKAVF